MAKIKMFEFRDVLECLFTFPVTTNSTFLVVSLNVKIIEFIKVSFEFVLKFINYFINVNKHK